MAKEKFNLNDLINVFDNLGEDKAKSKHGPIRRPKTDNDKTPEEIRELLSVAYYLARMNKNGLRALGYLTFNSAYEDIAYRFNRKFWTIKNMRDEFDPYFENGRAGWYQRELRKSRQEVFDFYKDMDDVELTHRIKLILSNHTGNPNIKKEDC